MRKTICLFLIVTFCLANSFSSTKTNSRLFLKTNVGLIKTVLTDTIISSFGINLFRTAYQITIPDSLQNKYAGTYQMTMDKSRTMEILKQENHLVAKYSKDIVVALTPKSTTEFAVEGIQPEALIKFILEKGKVTRYIVYQNGPYEWKKIK